MDPFALRKIHIPVFPGFKVDRGHQKVAPQQVFILDGIRPFILLMVKEQRPLHRYALFGIFLYQGLHVRGQHGIDIHQPCQLSHAVLILIILEIRVRAVPLMGTHHRREHGHLGPS